MPEYDETTETSGEILSMPQTLSGKEILLGVTGSIAAYKAADLCSRLGKLGANVHVVLTMAAARFVGAATFRALTRNPVVTDVFEEPTAKRIAHIDLAQSAHLVLVAPASADILARMAHGLADDMLSTCLLATPPATPVLVAPAMNTVMWEHPATVANVQTLTERGVQFIAPGYGLLACQDVGAGKLADVEDIVAAVQARLETKLEASESVKKTNAQVETNANVERKWAGKRVLITAGATREPLDPVRFLSNRSSGKMGYAIAEEAIAQGADVTLVSGFATAVAPSNVRLIKVGTAQEMLAACQSHFAACDVFIASAAVADYAPETVHAQKMKKPMTATNASAQTEEANAMQSEEANNAEITTLRLKRTPDIVATLAAGKQPGQIVVGFAAETEHLLAHARAKLETKRLDLIVANDITMEGAGFETDTNIVTLLWPDGRMETLPQMSKREVGRALLNVLLC